MTKLKADFAQQTNQEKLNKAFKLIFVSDCHHKVKSFKVHINSSEYTV